MVETPISYTSTPGVIGYLDRMAIDSLCFKGDELGGLVERMVADPNGRLKGIMPYQPRRGYGGLPPGTKDLTLDVATVRLGVQYDEELPQGGNVLELVDQMLSEDQKVLALTARGDGPRGKQSLGYWAVTDYDGNFIPLDEHSLPDEDFMDLMERGAGSWEGNNRYWQDWARFMGHSYSVSLSPNPDSGELIVIGIPDSKQLVVTSVLQEGAHHKDALR
tara:strand:- start:4935 stop:5591 length:657 start_codon:yes stop_codon:yes gene_type:complete